MDASREQLEALLHELQVQHIELQLQNRQLQDAQTLLEESRGRYADLYDFAPIGYCTVTEDCRVIDANLAAARRFSMHRDQLLGRHLGSLVSSADRAGLFAHFRRAGESETPVTCELSFSGRGPGEGSFVLHLATSRRREGLLTALIDVSSLKELEQRLSHLAYAGDVLSASLDESTTLAAITHLVVPRLADLCIIDLIAHGGVTRPQVLFSAPSKQARFAERVREGAERPGWQTPQRRCIVTGEPSLVRHAEPIGAPEHEPWLADACAMMIVPLTARKRVLGALTLVSIESGRRYDAADLLFAQDLAKRAAIALDNAALHEQSRRATHERDDVLSMVAHDLKNPLTVIFAKAEQLLRGGAADADRARKWAEAIFTAAERMRVLIRDVLDMARIEARGLTLKLAPATLGPVLDDTVKNLGAFAAEHQVALEVDCPDPRLEVPCDRLRISQVLENLVGNAIKFSPEGGVVTVRVERRAAELWFSICDRGPGLDVAHVARVFDRFWQAKATARLGTGLGLAIAKGVVEAHHGQIRAEPREGGGAIFSFSLPLAAERLVLVIEGDPDERARLGRAVETGGYRAVALASGAEGLARLTGSPLPAAIILDVAVPVVDGWELLERRERDPALKAIGVVVVSALPLGPRLSAYGVAFLEKPAGPLELLAALARVAARQ